LRYARGILYGFILSGFIFLGTAFIKWQGIGVSDSTVMVSLWALYTTWFYVCVALTIIPLVIAFARFRSEFRQILFFEAGGLFFFTPFWFFFTSEITGTSISETLTTGVKGAVPYFNENFQITGMNISPVILLPLLLAMFVAGLYILRPSFVYRAASAKAPRELTALKEKPKEKPKEDMDSDMPDVKPPVADSSSIGELRSLLAQLSVPQTIIEAIVTAGIATVTDLISTSPDSLAAIAGIDPKMAQDIHLSVQKKVWFGGIE
jgi:hypothetical protein